MFHFNFLMIKWSLRFICCKPTVDVQEYYRRRLRNTMFHSNNPDVICLPSAKADQNYFGCAQSLYSVYI